MKIVFPLLIAFILLFCQCKQPETLVNSNIHQPEYICGGNMPVAPIYFVDVIVSSIFYQKDTLQIDVLPKTFENDTSDLIHSINKHIRYSEMCKEMQVQGKIYFEISKDSIGNFTNTKILRGIGGTCTEWVSKELNRILKKAPIIEVPAKINSFILAINIKIWKR